MYIILALIVGIVVGYRYCVWISGREFQTLADQGQLVVRTPEGWAGTDDAIESIKRTAKNGEA